ncbi:MAG: class I SAM-dependent rRNA methyltransferase [Boseongicola sp.]|nr:class I SAM-dependent rRNA methyltransferase [Boseongicola sp.]
MQNDRPTIRLKPKSDPRRIRRGFPWVYDNEIVTDRRTKAIAPGTVATLEDSERRAVATVTVNPVSKIFARLLDRDAQAAIDRDWIIDRVTRAADLRKAIYDAPFYRLIHAEADGLPGVIVDRFGDVAVIQPNSAWAEAHLNELMEAVAIATGARIAFKNASGRSRTLEGLNDVSVRLISGDDLPIPVPMNGATYFADLVGGQKTGLFFDQRDNHAFVASLARQTRVLDVFSHVGGFALAALANGAADALAVDGSEPALALARQGAEATCVADRFDTRTGDAFDTMSALAAEGRTFGTVICDPPAFAPHKGALDAGLRAYEKVARLGASLVAPGGTLTLCSCSHAADLDRFRAASIRGIGRAGRSSQILRTGFAGPDHPQHPQLAESGYLKAITFRLMP